MAWYLWTAIAVVVGLGGIFVARRIIRAKFSSERYRYIFSDVPFELLHPAFCGDIHAFTSCPCLSITTNCGPVSAVMMCDFEQGDLLRLRQEIPKYHPPDPKVNPKVFVTSKDTDVFAKLKKALDDDDDFRGGELVT